MLIRYQIRTGGGGNVPPPPRETSTTSRPESSRTSSANPLTQMAKESVARESQARPSQARPTPPADRPPPPPPPSSNSGNNNPTAQQSLTQSALSQTDLFSDMNSNMILQSADNMQQDSLQDNQRAQQNHESQERTEARQKMAEKAFLMQNDDSVRNRQSQFKQLMGSQKDAAQWQAKHQENLQNKQQASQQNAQNVRGNQTQENPLMKLRSQSQGLTKDNPDAPWKKQDGKMPLPKGYSAFMDVGPRGKQLFIQTQKALKGQDAANPENMAEHANPDQALEKETHNSAKSGLMSQASSTLQKKMQKQAGGKEGEDMLEAEEELAEQMLEEGSTGVEDSDGLSALRKAMQAKLAKAKARGEEGGEVGGAPWETFGEAIEAHTVLFGDAGHAESANLVSQASFASAIIYGAGMHIKVKGGRLNYSGTSHHGLPIPSGDEALEMGAKELVAGLERDVGQLGVESIFVNGQRFELANPDDERKLKELIKENPDLYITIQSIREAIRDGRFYRTCMGLLEEGPGGRA